MYIWTGFDYLGEPTPYGWPSRSSYFGIVDLAGFPKDAYYLYKSEWTDEPVLHVFPHWNWNDGDIVDVWAYTNCDEVDLFLNDNSLGIKKKSENDHHLMWRIKYAPGTLKAVGYKKGKEIITSVVKTAGSPTKIILEVDRNKISADGRDLSFVTVKVLDKNNTMVPYANNLINFKILGEGKIVGVGNGSETSHESFKANFRKAFNGMCLVVIQSSEKAGEITFKASSDGLESASIEIETK
jgi:beta-galactosidase